MSVLSNAEVSYSSSVADICFVAAQGQSEGYDRLVQETVGCFRDLVSGTVCHLSTYTRKAGQGQGPHRLHPDSEVIYGTDLQFQEGWERLIFCEFHLKKAQE